MGTMNIARGGRLSAWGYAAEENEALLKSAKPPRVLLSADGGGVSANIGMLSTDEARELAAHLLAAADEAQGEKTGLVELLKAAPDLLEALKLLMEEAENFEDIGTAAAVGGIAAARAAIAKAEGRS